MPIVCLEPVDLHRLGGLTLPKRYAGRLASPLSTRPSGSEAVQQDVSSVAYPVPRLTYVLQFHRPADRGTEPDAPGSTVPTRATGLTVTTALTDTGFDCSHRYIDGGTATLDLTFTTNQEGTLFFEWGSLAVGSPSGPMLMFRSVGAGQLSPTAAGDGFSHGTVMYEVTGGTGMFEEAQGFITSNFLVNLTTNELIDTHLGILQLR